MGKGRSLINSIIGLQKNALRGGNRGSGNKEGLGDFVNVPTTRQGDLTAYDFSAEDIKELDQNQQLIESAGIEYQQDQKVGQLLRALKSANDSSSLYGISAKKLSDSGSIHQKAFVDSASAQRTLDALKRKEASDKFLNGLQGSWFKTTGAGSYAGSRTIFGKDNQEAFKRALEAMGGKAVFSGETASYSYPLTDEEVYGKTPNVKDLKNTKWWKTRDERASANIANIEEKNFGDIFRRADADRRKQQSKDEEQQKMQDKAEEKENKRKTLTAFSKTIAIITILTDITRRILTSVLSSATKARADAIQANALGMTYYQQRSFNQIDRAHGLAEGTTTNAIADLQNMFGDVTNLDEKALGSLARVMGGSVSEMVRSGMGGQEPAKLLEMIMNKYFDQFKQGKNSLGQYVGQDQALRELTTVLNEISPNLAQIFSTMAVQSKTGMYKGRFNDYTEYLETSMVNRGGLTDTELSAFVALGDVVNSTKDVFAQIGETLKTKFANSISDLIGIINDTRIGESADKKEEHNKRNREKLKKSLAVDEERLALDRMIVEGGLGKGEYAEFADLSLEDIRKYAEKDPNKLKGEERQKAQHVQDLLAKASLSSDQNMFAHIGQALATMDRMDDINKQLAKKSGKVMFNEAEHSDEGKALADRNRMLALRQGFTDSNGGSWGANNLYAQIAGTKETAFSTVDLSKLDPNALSALQATMARYYDEYGHSLYNVNEEGGVSLDASFGRKTGKGNYSDPMLKAMIKNYNATVGEGQKIETTAFGNITEKGYERVLSILEAGEKAKLKYMNEDGSIDEKAFQQDSSYNLYSKMKNAELSGFADLMTDTSLPFGERADSIRSFKNSAEAMEKELQEQAEALTKVNSSLLSTGSTVEAIRDIVAQANSSDSTTAYLYRRYEQGKTDVKVQLVLKDEKGNVIMTKDIVGKPLASGAQNSATVVSEIPIEDAVKMVNQ